MELSAIEHDNAIPPKHRGGTLGKDLLAQWPNLSPSDNIFYPETDKARQHKMYNSLFAVAKRNNLRITVRFFDDGLRVWKVQ